MEPTRPPRVAFFPDSFGEVNGVAHTARQFTAWAARTGKPFLLAHDGWGSFQTPVEAAVELLELPRGFASFALEKDLRYDPLFLRHLGRALRALRAFRPDIVHITGPSDFGVMGAILAHRLRVPLVASWHTNVHEYAARRSGWALRALPPPMRQAAAREVEQASLRLTARFYRTARLLFAPNPALCQLLADRTGKPCLPMERGIDEELFSPAHRTTPAPGRGGIWTLGYVGRLSVEKNVALLPRIAAELRARDLRVRFVLVGQGAEEAALRAALPDGCFAGVLRGEALAEAYSNMDLFVFPSHTDTFGNVVLEALASGVPSVVTPDGGPAHIVRASNGGGLLAEDAEFADAIASLMRDPERHAAMRERARAYAASASWDAVFSGVYEAYGRVIA